MPLTLQQLAKTAHVSASHLGRIERGERFPSARILRKIAGPLNTEEQELFALAGYLTEPPSFIEGNPIEGNPVPADKQLDPGVARQLSKEPFEIQRHVINILEILRNMSSKSGLVAEQSEQQ